MVRLVITALCVAAAAWLFLYFFPSVASTELFKIGSFSISALVLAGLAMFAFVWRKVK